MVKHRVSLSDEEIDILLEALDSADFYSDDNEFYEKLRKLKKRLEDVRDIAKYFERSRRGRFGAYMREERLREKIRDEIFSL